MGLVISMRKWSDKLDFKQFRSEKCRNVVFQKYLCEIKAYSRKMAQIAAVATDLIDFLRISVKKKEKERILVVLLVDARISQVFVKK